VTALNNALLNFLPPGSKIEGRKKFEAHIDKAIKLLITMCANSWRTLRSALPTLKIINRINAKSCRKDKGKRQREWPKPQEVGPDIKANIRDESKASNRQRAELKFPTVSVLEPFYTLLAKKNGVRM